MSNAATLLEEAQALTHLGSWEWDIAANTISWSDEMYRIYGFEPQIRPIGFDEFMSMIHEDDRERISGIIGMSFKMAKPFKFEHRIVTATNRERVLLGMGKVITDKAGKPMRMLGTSQDITGQKQSEQALLQSDKRFRAVTQATHDLVFDLDLQSGIIWFNEALQTEYGYRKAVDTTFEWFKSHIHPDDSPEVEKQISKLLKSKQKAWQAEYRLRKADGSYTVVRNRSIVLRDSSGKPERLIGSFLDITEARRLDRAKDEFVSLVSHQLRTPLTIIRLYGDMLSDGLAGPLATKQKTYVNKITFASVRLIKLVGDILNISRLELNRIKVNSSPTDANKLIKDRMSELAPIAKSRGTQIDFAPDTSLSLVPIDATVFGEIVHNLVNNSIRYAGHEGKKGIVKVSFTLDERGYLLSVQDNGIGIPKAAEPHIFERFYRAGNATNFDGEGTGLGLYLVRLFTETGGGKTWFESKENIGTTFYVLFPPDGMKPKTT
jgi:PAS domain S-box-containing protein